MQSITDKELLELAAKAAGYEDATWNTEHGCIETAHLEGLRCWWNPLANDGDAFRLAVKLGLDIELHGMLQTFQYGSVSCMEYGVDSAEYEVLNNDPYEATRRAIVRAAAEIGKGMKCQA